MGEALRTPLSDPAPSRAQTAAPARPRAARDEGAVTALVLAVAGYVALPVIPAVMAIREGLAARRRLQDSPDPGRWMATAAVLLGAAELLLTALVVIALVWFPLLVPGS